MRYGMTLIGQIADECFSFFGLAKSAYQEMMENILRDAAKVDAMNFRKAIKGLGTNVHARPTASAPLPSLPSRPFAARCSLCAVRCVLRPFTGLGVQGDSSCVCRRRFSRSWCARAQTSS